MNLQLTDYSLDDLAKVLGSGQAFAFSRWGDGEWRAVLGTRKQVNCDGHPYTRQLQKDLRRVLRSDPPYLLGMQPLAVRILGEDIERWLASENLNLRWVDADVCHRAAKRRQLGPLVTVLRDRPLVVVGPPHLRDWAGRMGGAYVRVSPAGCHHEVGRVVNEVAAHLDRMTGAVVSISAGPSANLMVDQLWRSVGGHAFVDFGSLWDPRVGVRSRRYMQEL